MKRRLLYVVLFLLLFALVVMGTFSRLSASGNIKDNVYPNQAALLSPPPPVPVNDLPCDATALSLTTSLATYSNEGAINSGIADPCGKSITRDVWFKTVVPADGEVIITTYSERNIGWLNKVGFTVYSGSCGSLTEIDCYSAPNPDFDWTVASLAGRTPGETLYIRVYDDGNLTGDFQIYAIGSCEDIVAGTSAGSGGESCDLDFTFNATGTGAWSLVSGPGEISNFSTSATDPNTTVSVSQEGTYVFAWPVTTALCSEAETISVLFRQPIFSVPKPVVAECNTLSSTLEVLGTSGVGNPIWSKESGPGTVIISTPTEYTSVVNVSEYGEYVFKLTVTNESCSESNTSTVNFYEEPSVATVGDNQDHCETLTCTNLGGNTPTVGTGEWSQFSGPAGSTTSFNNIISGSTDATSTVYGTYVYRWTISNGSCAPSTADITVNYLETPPTINAGADAEICETQNSYVISGSSSSNPSAILWTTSGNGSFSNATIDNPTYTIGSTDVGTITLTKQGTGSGSCTQPSDEMLLTIIPTPTANAGVDADACGLSYALSAKASIGTGTWSLASGDGNIINFSTTENDPNATVSVDTYGTYQFTWTEVNGICSDSQNVTIIFHSLPAAYAGADDEICESNNSYPITGSTSANGTIKWTTSGNGTFDNDAIDNPIYTIGSTDTGTITLTKTVDNAFCSAISDDMLLTIVPAPTANAGGNADACGLSYALSATASIGTGTWSLASGDGNIINFSTTENDPNATVSVDTYGTYQFTWTEVNGICSDSQNVTIVFHSLPAAYAGANDEICESNNSYPITGSTSANGTIEWTTSGNGTFDNDAIDNPIYTIGSTDTGTITLTKTVDNAFCSAISDEMLLTIIPSPTANAGVDADACGLSYALSAKASIGTGTWSLASGDGNIINFSTTENDPNATVSVDTYGTYQFTWTEVNGICSDSQNVTIIFHSLPAAYAGADDEICESNNSYPITGSTSANGTIKWTTSGNGTFDNDAIDNPIYTIGSTDTGTITLTKTVDNAFCSAISDDMLLTIVPAPTANAGGNADACGLSYALSATASIGTGTWSLASGDGNIINFSTTENDPNATVSVDTYGTYQFTWTEVNGICSDSQNVTIVFHSLPAAYAGANDEICESNNSYPITGSTSANGTIKWTTSGNGTFDNDAIDNPIYTIGSTDTGIITLTKTVDNAFCSAISDDMLLTIVPAPTANAGIDADACGLSYALSAAASIGTGTWSLASGDGNIINFSTTENDPNATVSVDTYGTYQFTWTEVNGICSDSQNVTIVFHSLPAAYAGADDEICESNNSYTISGSTSANGTIKWTTSGNGTFDNDAIDNPIYTIGSTDTGIITLTKTVDNAFCSAISDDMLLTIVPAPTANAGLNADACGLSYALSATASIGTGTWSLASGDGNIINFSTTENDPNATVSVDTYGTYQFTWTEVNGICSDSQNVTIVFHSLPAAYAGANDEICESNNSYPITGSTSANGTIKWTTSGNGTFDNDAIDNPIYTIGSTDTGIITLTKTVDNAFCSAISDDMLLTIVPAPTANAGVDADACGLSYALSAKASIGTGTWSLASGDGNIINFSTTENDPNATVSVDTYGTYQFTWTEVNGICSDSQNVTIIFHSLPAAYAGADDEICESNNSYPITGSTSANGTIKWTTSGNGTFDNDAIDNPIYTIGSTDSGTITLTKTVDNAFCSAISDDMLLTIVPAPTANAGGNADACGLSYALSAAASIGTGTWSLASGDGNIINFSTTENDPNATVSVDTYGTYQFTWTEVNGICSDSQNVTIVFHSLPAAYAGADDEICESNNSYTISGSTSANGTIKWTTSGNGTFDNDAIDNPIYTIGSTDTGIITLTKTVDNAFCSAISDDMELNIWLDPAIATVGSSQNHCGVLSSESLGGNTPLVGTGTWTQISGPGTTTFSDSNLGNSIATATQYGSYLYRWTISNGLCSSTTADIIVIFNEGPTIASVVSDQAYCGSFISNSLDGNTPLVGTGAWSQISGPGLTNFSSISAGNSTATVDSYGTYLYRWTITNGVCSSLDDITVNFNQTPVSNAGADETICGANTFTIAGSTSANGTISWSSSGSGTFNDNTIDNPTYNFGTGESGIITLTKTVGNPGCSFVSDDMTITFSPGPTANAGIGGNECDLDFTLSAVASVGVGTWTKTGGLGNAVFFPNANTPNATVNVDSYGTYEFTWTEISDACADSEIISVSFYQQPIADAGVGGDECDFDYTLSASKSTGIGTWTKESGLGNISFSPNANDPKAIVTTDTYGSYKLRWTEINGSCSDYDELIVNFYKHPVANAGNGGDECDLDFIFNATPSVGAGKWMQVSGPGTSSFFPNSSFSKGTVTVSSFGSYQFSWTETNGNCIDSKLIDVSFYDQPAANAGFGGNMCGLTFSLIATPSLGNGTWTKVSGSGNASFLPNANSANSIVNVDSYGTYSFRWTEDNGTCSASDEVTVNFYEQPIANAGLGGDQCGLEYTLSANSSVGQGVWTKLSGIGNATFIPNVNTPNATVIVDSYDTYQFSWSEENSVCSDFDIIDVTFHEQPIAYAGEDVEMDIAKQIQLNAILSTSGTGKWSVLSGNAFLSDPYSPNTDLDKLSFGENILQWTETNQICVDSDEIKLTVDNLYIPTVITPNGDKKNDYFVIRGFENLGDIQLTILNRKGIEVYTDKNYQNDWNGLDKNGNELIIDTYFYVIKLKTNKVFKGYIVIKR